VDYSIGPVTAESVGELELHFAVRPTMDEEAMVGRSPMTGPSLDRRLSAVTEDPGNDGRRSRKGGG
jgi:hypothetical protein